MGDRYKIKTKSGIYAGSFHFGMPRPVLHTAHLDIKEDRVQIEISSVVNISIISVRTITPSQIQNITLIITSLFSIIQQSDFFVNNFGKRGDSDMLWRALSIEIAFKQECAEVRECVNIVFVTYIA